MKTYNRVMLATYFGNVSKPYYRACIFTNDRPVSNYSAATLDELLTIARDKKCNRFIFEFIDGNGYLNGNGYLTRRYDIPLM